MIPIRAHFIWFGREFPFSHALAIRSVAATCSLEAIVLHASDELRGQPHFDALLRDIPMFAHRKLDIAGLLATDGVPDPPRLRAVWDRLVAERRWAALSDVARYLVLLRDGGVYLDLDTITLRDLRPLLDGPGFCGREHLLVNGQVHLSRSRLRYLRTVPLDVARWYCRTVERGIPLFRRISRHFPAAVNGAVLALPAAHELLREALRRVPDLAPRLDERRPILGPDLLQDLTAEDGLGVKVFEPEYFYPLGPGMAQQLFKLRKDRASVERAVAEAIAPETHVVHWYSHGTRPTLPDGPEAVRALADRQIFSHLAVAFLPAH